MRAVVDDADGKRAEDIARLFAAELRSRHIAVCTAPSQGAPPPLGVVAVRTSSEAAFVEVDVRDDLTAKSLKREIALADVPSDVRALTVAVAADELLRASWAELAVKNALSPKQQAKIPAEVRDVVRDTMVDAPRREVAPRIAFGAGAALDAFTGGSTLLGADVLLDVWIVSRLRVVARFGLRSGLATSGADGDVATSAFAFKLGGAVTLTPPELRAGLDVGLRAGVMRVAFVATPSSGAVARSLADVAVVADAALLGWLRLAPNLRALVDAALSVPLRPVVATDGAAVVTGVSGVGVSATLGLWGTF